MIFLYSLLLILLGAIKFLVDRRAAFLSWRYARASSAVDGMLREPIFKEGNSNKANPCKIAQRQFLLGLMVQKKERLEAKHFTWSSWSDRLGRFIDRLRNWKGKKLPYTLGALDVWLLLYLIDHLGVSEHVSARKVIDAAAALFAK
jgi:hypothetical protein